MIQNLAALFFELYKGLDRAYGTYVTSHPDERGKMQGKAITLQKPYMVDLWEYHLKGQKGIGVIPITDEAICWWGAIDIDTYPLDLFALEQKVIKTGVPFNILRSKSGGAHLTIFFNEPVQCSIVRSKLTEIAVSLGYGGCEIYPKQVRLSSKMDTGNWLNMPYFDAERTTRFGVHNGKPQTITEFLERAYDRRITSEQFTAIHLNDPFDDGPPCLQSMAKQGIPEGGRNNTLFTIGVYLRVKYEDLWDHYFDQYNQEYLDPPLHSKELQAITRSLGKKTYTYPCSQHPIVSHCNKELCRKRRFGISKLNVVDLGVQINNIRKLDSDPPIWIMDVDGHSIELETADLMNQESFRRACLAITNRIPGKIPAVEWEKLIRELLENLDIKQAPKEVRVKDRAVDLVYQFLMVQSPAATKDEMAIGRPFVDDHNFWWFKASDYIRYLSTNNMREPDMRKIWMAIENNGGRQIIESLNGFPTQVWGVPYKSKSGVELKHPGLPKQEF